jgi:hypothetical protein
MYYYIVISYNKKTVDGECESAKFKQLQGETETVGVLAPVDASPTPGKNVGI